MSEDSRLMNCLCNGGYFMFQKTWKEKKNATRVLSSTGWWLWMSGQQQFFTSPWAVNVPSRIFSFALIRTSNDNFDPQSSINRFQNQTKQDLLEAGKGWKGKSVNMAAKSGDTSTSVDMCASKPGRGSASRDLIPPALTLQGIVDVH